MAFSEDVQHGWRKSPGELPGQRSAAKKLSTLHRESSLTLEVVQSDQRQAVSTDHHPTTSLPSQRDDASDKLGCRESRAVEPGRGCVGGGGKDAPGRPVDSGGGHCAEEDRGSCASGNSPRGRESASPDASLNEFERRLLKAKKSVRIRMPDVGRIRWYHKATTRHIAESLLLARHMKDGTYLLRDSTSPDSLTLSVRCKTSVRHYRITWDGTQFCFGLGNFKTVNELMEHFENQPVISGDSGLLVKLCNPYPRNVEEPADYDEATYHLETLNLDPPDLAQIQFKLLSQDKSPNASLNNGCMGKIGKQRKVGDSTELLQSASHAYGPGGQDFACNSKEGYLTKLGYHRKNWKRRWFVMFRGELKYFNSKEDAVPLRQIHLSDVQAVLADESAGKPNCFKMVTSYRTFFMFADNETEAEEWLEILQWKLDNAPHSSSPVAQPTSPPTSPPVPED